MRAHPVIAGAVLVALLLAPPLLATRAAADDEPPAPTIQNRFASNRNTLGLHAFVTSQFRGDFYHQIGLGGSVAYYPLEALGLEVTGTGFFSWLNDTAHQLTRETGWIPDTRRRNGHLLLGGRLSFGYGKLQVAEAFVVHFDPQLVVQLGVTFADEDRFLPTGLAGFAMLFHFDFGLQVRLDLMAIMDLEERTDRGMVASVGFAPLLAVGWRADLGAL